MAKKGMSRIDRTHTRVRNTVAPVPEIQGKAKHGKEHAKPIIPGTKAPSQEVFHSTPHPQNVTVSSDYSIFNNDLASDNLQNDITAADLQDLQ